MAALAKSYLALLATLAAIALAPVLLGWTASVVQSGSMEPRISAGDVVLTSPLPADSPLPIGNVVTFRVDDLLVVHRIASVSDDGTLVTAGDANAQFDPWSPRREDVTGEARVLIPFVGLPGFWLAHDQVLPFALWTAGTVAALLAAVALHPRVTNTGGSRSGPGGGVRRRRIPMVVATAGILALTLPSFPHVDSEAAFTARTSTALAMSAKSYPALTLGALAEYGAVAAVAVRDTSGLFENSYVTGSVAATPGQTVSGYGTRDITGSTRLNDAAARSAMTAASTAAAALSARDVTASLAPSLSGTIPRGVYTSTSGAFTIPGTLTLDAKGDPSARFVFRTTGALTLNQAARIVLANGAQASNVWWVVGTTATIGGTSILGGTTTAVGTYLVTGEVALRRTTLTGRAVSFTASVSSNVATITVG